MKNLLLLIILSSIFSCQSKKQLGDGYHINGKATSVVPGSTVFLEEVVENQFVRRDSTLIGDDSLFKFTGKVSEPSFYRLVLGNNQFVYLVLDNQENVQVEFSNTINIGNNYKIKGSKQNAYLQEMNFLDASFQEQTREIRDQFESAKDEIGRRDAEHRFYELQQTYNKQYKTFLDTAKTSIVVLMTANTSSCISFDDDLDYLEKLAKRYQKELPNSKYTKQFSERVNASRKVAVGSIAPDFTLQTINHKPLKMTSLRGKLILLDFWASWCAPCREENPNVVKTYQEFKEKGFDILSISLDSENESWEAAIKKDKLTWNHVSDLKSWDSEVVKMYGVTGIPFTLLLDKEGKIIAKNLRGAELNNKLKTVLE